MNRSAVRLIHYYANGHYRGFYPVEGERQYKIIGNELHLTFTNGQTKITASGKFREDTLLAILNRIDEYHKMLVTPLV